MKILHLAPVVLSLVTFPVLAQTAPPFSEADADGNGVLSIEEASQALGISISDSNGDGNVNVSEANGAVSSLMLEGEDSATVGSEEYDQIVQALSEGED